MRLKLVLLLLSTLASVLLLEVGLRLFTHHPITRTSHKIPDPELGYRVDPDFKGIDDDGFRNRKVLETCDVVAIGDSHTFGNNVEAEYSWPRQLETMLKRTVYNLGVGGYGFIEYAILLDRAVELSPEYVVVGVYLANDLEDVLRALNQEHGQKWARANGYEIEMRPAVPRELDRTLKGRKPGASTAIGSVIREIGLLRKQTEATGVVVREAPNRTFISHARITKHARFMDARRPKMEIALDVASRFFEEAKRKTEAHDIDLVILFIPSKETVFYEYLTDRGYELTSRYHDLARNERQLTARMKKILEETGVDYTDALPALRNILVSKGNLYSNSDDGHPTRTGYRAYAQTVYEHLIARRND